MAKIKRFGVLKTSSFMGLLGVAAGLVSVILMLLLFSFFSGLFAPVDYVDDVGNNDDFFGTGNAILGDLTGDLQLFDFNYIYFLYFPVIYGIIWFILGLIFTPITNLILKIIKGLDLDIEMYEEHKSYQPPVNYQPQNFQPPQNSQQQNYQNPTSQQQDYPKQNY
jgi:hypothetical protein